MRVADLHCDTATKLFAEKWPLSENDCHISLQKTAGFSQYLQLMAVFTSPSLSDEEGYRRFFDVAAYLRAEAEKNGIPFARDGGDVRSMCEGCKTVFVLTVEDARILAGDLSRVDALAACGVRVITPLWGGLTCMGGSHDRPEGLSDFGKAAVQRMCALGIIPDRSHASFASADDILDIAEEMHAPVIATHMNSYTVCRHTRNLTDERCRRLASLGGVVGISLCPPHLTECVENGCTAEDAARHILYDLSLCGEDGVCLGSDWDGTHLPSDLPDISALPVLWDLLTKKHGVTEAVCDKIFYANARRFLEQNLA